MKKSNIHSLKSKYYRRLLNIYLQVPYGNSMISKGNVSTNCFYLMEDLPLPFSCKHLEISITPQQLERGEDGIFICGKSGCMCQLCNENFDGNRPDHCEIYLD